MNRHYEVVFLANPDQSEQLPGIIQRYYNIIESNNGVIHRYEDWGRRQLAYPIKKVTKAHYILMNIECNDAVLAELNHSFRFNDAILRGLILKRKKAITDLSPMLRPKEKTDKPKRFFNNDFNKPNMKEPVTASMDTEKDTTEVVTTEEDETN